MHACIYLCARVFVGRYEVGFRQCPETPKDPLRYWKPAMINVNPDQLKTVVRILAKHVPQCEVRAFGARVTQTANDKSDLDLVVVGGRALDIDALSRLKEAFEESDLSFRVGVLDWHAIDLAMQKVIDKKYEVVQRQGKKSSRTEGEWKLYQVGELIESGALVVGDGYRAKNPN